MTALDEILDDLFHGCAFAAFVEEAAKVGGPPCADRTRQRAYEYYEASLAESRFCRFNLSDRNNT
jgi:hypothetical protein